MYYPSTFYDYDLSAVNDYMADFDVEYALDNNSANPSNWTWKGVYFRNSSFPNLSGTAGASSVYTQQTSVTYANLVSGTEYYYLDTNGEYYPVNASRRRANNSWIRPTYFYTLEANGAILWTNDTDHSESAAYQPIDAISNQNASFTGVALYISEINAGTTLSGNRYAPWMHWGVDSTGNSPAYIHSGMVTGLVNGMPNFTASYAHRLFDNTVIPGKTIYHNVGMPFVFDSETGYYSFDSAKRGAYFANGAESNVNLTLLDSPVIMLNSGPNDGYTGNGRYNWYTGFMPFDIPEATGGTYTYRPHDSSDNTMSGQAYLLTSATNGPKNYFFGATINIPFSMTNNGRILASDDNSAPIKFEFTGDDDVWVFVDGVLVLDLGGIHDCVSGSIDFANNEVLYAATGQSKVTGDASGIYPNGGAGEYVSQGKIFNESGVSGKINMTRTTFAATETHILTLVYMERGAGLSNCKIDFNLPQKDYVEVVKEIDTNLYDKDNQDVVVGAISPELFDSLNNRLFTFMLCENGIPMANKTYSLYDSNLCENGIPMANKTYSLYDSNGDFINNSATNSNGFFSIRNNQFVRFYDVDLVPENNYYVVEVQPGVVWGTPRFEATAVSAYGYTTGANDYTGTDYASNAISASGSAESVDRIIFNCNNKLLSPIADTSDDVAVIDYGLDVTIDVLADDTYSGGNELLSAMGISLTEDGVFSSTVEGRYGTFTIVNGKVLYRPTSIMNGVDRIYYATEVNGTEAGTAMLTVVPATQMYYEESFDNGDFIQYVGNSTNDWEPVGIADVFQQEPGLVGNVNSPYGTDSGYTNSSSLDSYNTVRSIYTGSGAARFSYDFTGTGTTIFARLTQQTGYIRIVIDRLDENFNVVEENVVCRYRDTIILPNQGGNGLNLDTLYNVPVYDINSLEYGNYRMTVTVLRAGMPTGVIGGAGGYFYLDGIRIYNPLDPSLVTPESGVPAGDYEVANYAYNSDGELNNVVVQIRDKTLSNDGSMNLDVFVTFTDVTGEVIDAEEYSSIGPKSEVYIYDGQSISFSLSGWDPNTCRVFLGIMSPIGSGTVTIGNHELDVSHTFEAYYDISAYGDIITREFPK